MKMSYFLWMLAIIIGIAIITAHFHSKSRVINNNFNTEIIVKNGDLVFRKGRSVESEIVLVTDRESLYSHVGIIQIIEEVPFVIHTVPGDGVKGSSLVKQEALSVFFNSENAVMGSVFRIKREYAKTAFLAAEKARSFHKNKLVFDGAYDLKSENELYCTELVWKAYIDSGMDLIQGDFDQLFGPFNNAKIIFPSSLLKSQYLTEIYRF